MEENLTFLSAKLFDSSIPPMPSLQIKESPFLRQLVRHRTVLIVALYAAVAACSLRDGFLLRFDFKLEPQYKRLFWIHLGWVMVAKLVLMALAGQFRGLLTFFGVRDAFRIGIGSFTLAVLLIAVLQVLNPPGEWLPRGVVFIDAAVFTGLMGALRLTLRAWGEYQSNRAGTTHRELVPVAVIGAGEVGAKLIEELRRKPKMGLDPVIVLDDNREKWGLKIHGIPIIGAPEALADAAKRYGIHEVLLATPGASNARMREIVRVCHTANLQCVAVPSMEQLATGKVAVSQLKPVAIEDLLGRESIAMDPAIVLLSLKDRVVMVTGQAAASAASYAGKWRPANPACSSWWTNRSRACFRSSRNCWNMFAPARYVRSWPISWTNHGCAVFLPNTSPMSFSMPQRTNMCR